MPQQMPTPPTPQSTPQGLQPKSLFTTPRSSSRSASRSTSLAGTPQTPSNLDISDTESMSSGQNSVTSVTPDMGNLTLGRSRGRPCKALVKATYEDFPIEASEEEQKRYIKKKRTELWRYNKLTGSGSSDYRKSELSRVKEYQKKKKDTEGGASASDESRDSSSEHKKQLSHAR